MRPQTKRQIRAQARDLRLQGLGYRDYQHYLRSAAWRDVKRRYSETCPMVCMCGDTSVEIHHTTYDRVGEEYLDDLIALCRACHQQAHVLEAAGVIDLDLDGFYYDLERAYQYAGPERARKAQALLQHQEGKAAREAIPVEARRAKKNERIAMLRKLRHESPEQREARRSAAARRERDRRARGSTAGHANRITP